MGRLRAGICRVDITPPLGVEPGAWRLRTGRADGVHEPLVAQALVLDDGSRRIALVATDLLWMPRHVAAAARRRAATLTGIPADAILLNASHNHSAPVLLEPDSVRAAVRTDGLDGYAAALPDRLAGAVFGACARLQAAAVGGGTGRAPGISVNRVDPRRSVDDTVTVLRVDGPSGVMAVVAGFACHGTCVRAQRRQQQASHRAPQDSDHPTPRAPCCRVGRSRRFESVARQRDADQFILRLIAPQLRRGKHGAQRRVRIEAGNRAAQRDCVRGALRLARRIHHLAPGLAPDPFGKRGECALVDVEQRRRVRRPAP